MDSYQRHKLKQDKFTTAVASSTHWAAEHRSKLIVASVLVVAAVLGISGFAYRQSSREHEASQQFGKALETYQSDIRPEGIKPTPGQESYASAKERAAAANKAFESVANAYPHTDSGQSALYMSGVTAAEMGDNARAEQALKNAADRANRDVAALAKLALANLYHASNRDADAIRLLTELRSNPTNSVPGSVAGLQLASIYENTDPQKALAIYGEIQKSDKGTGGDIAQQRMSVLSSQQAKK